jgi:predicted dehydrogenase
MNKKRIGVIGCGQWGPNQIRSFFFNPRTQVVRICDKSRERLRVNMELYPGIEGTTDFREITGAPDIDAVVVTTPVSAHFEIVQDALSHGKDVLCEKPLTLKSGQSETLAAQAGKNNLILMVGHVFLFNPGILELKKIIESGQVGDIHYLHAQRTNLGPVRLDTNAVYDLASHDISIFNFLLGSAPKVLSAIGKCYLQERLEDVAFISLEYPGNILAHIHVSWLDPKKVRQITVVGKKKMVTWNDLSLSGPIEIYAKQVEKEQHYKDFGDFHLLVKEGEVLLPHVKNVEPLKLQAEHFVDCVINRKKPLSDAESAVSVVRTLEAIECLLEKSR